MKTKTAVQCCSCHRATAEMEIGSNQVCWNCWKALKQYSICSICRKVLSKTLADLAFKRHTVSCCSRKACKIEADVAVGLLCCNKAKKINCVCVRAYKCPVHGEFHVGSHD